jgi:membrane-bound lytic murein transglycosylase D
MSATAKHYNLDVCNSYDERCDPVSSTAAAINYLNKLYAQFGKWYLAAIAYNCGEGRLKKAILKAGSDELGILTNESAKYLPKETRNYIRKILLIAMIGEEKYLDFPVTFSSKEEDVIQVEVPAGCNLTKLAEILKMKPSRLLGMNRQFKEGLVPRRKAHYMLQIPEDKIMRFYLKYEPKAEIKKVRPHLVSHRVAMGDTLEHIAEKYHSCVDEIKTVNRLEDDFLILDSLLLIPVSRETFEKMLRSM